LGEALVRGEPNRARIAFTKAHDRIRELVKLGCDAFGKAMRSSATIPPKGWAGLSFGKRMEAWAANEISAALMP